MPSPSIFNRFTRAVWPATSVTARGAMPNAFASTRTSAAFASPSTGAALTRTRRTGLPPVDCWMLSIAARPPLGVSRTASVRPPATTTHGRPPMQSGHVGQDVKSDHVAEENDDEDQDDRRDVDAAEIGHHIADWPQRRLGDAIEEVRDHCHELVARVDHV